MAGQYTGSEEYARYYRPYKAPKADDSEYLDLLRHGSDQQLDILRDTGTANAAALRERGSIYAGIPEKVVDNYLKGAKFRSDSQTAGLNRDRISLDMNLAQNKETRDADIFTEEQRLRPYKQQEIEAKIRDAVASGALTEEQAAKLHADNEFMTPERRASKFNAELEGDRAKSLLLNAERGKTLEETAGKRAERTLLDSPLSQAQAAPAKSAQIPFVIVPERRKAMVAEEQMRAAQPPAMPAPRTKREAIAQQKTAKAQMDTDYRKLQMRKLEQDVGTSKAPKISDEEKYQGSIKIEGANPKTGFRPTTDDAKNAKTAKKARDTIINGLDELDKLHAQYGTELVGDAATKMESINTQLLLAQKTLDELGVLNGPDLMLAGRQVPDPSSWDSNIKALLGQDRYGAKSSQYRQNVERQFRDTMGAAGYDVMGNPTKKPGASQGLTRQQKLDEINRLKAQLGK